MAPGCSGQRRGALDRASPSPPTNTSAAGRLLSAVRVDAVHEVPRLLLEDRCAPALVGRRLAPTPRASSRSSGRACSRPARSPSRCRPLNDSALCTCLPIVQAVRRRRDRAGVELARPVGHRRTAALVERPGGDESRVGALVTTAEASCSARRVPGGVARRRGSSTCAAASSHRCSPASSAARCGCRRPGRTRSGRTVDVVPRDADVVGSSQSEASVACPAAPVAVKPMTLSAPCVRGRRGARLVRRRAEVAGGVLRRTRSSRCPVASAGVRVARPGRLRDPVSGARREPRRRRAVHVVSRTATLSVDADHESATCPIEPVAVEPAGAERRCGVRPATGVFMSADQLCAVRALL